MPSRSLAKGIQGDTGSEGMALDQQFSMVDLSSEICEIHIDARFETKNQILNRGSAYEQVWVQISGPVSASHRIYTQVHDQVYKTSQHE